MNVFSTLQFAQIAITPVVGFAMLYSLLCLAKRKTRLQTAVAPRR